MEIGPELLKILVCPVCRVAVHPVAHSGLECRDCGRIYPCRDGIPVMLVAEASPPESAGPA